MYLNREKLVFISFSISAGYWPWITYTRRFRRKYIFSFSLLRAQDTIVWLNVCLADSVIKFHHHCHFLFTHRFIIAWNNSTLKKVICGNLHDVTETNNYCETLFMFWIFFGRLYSLKKPLMIKRNFCNVMSKWKSLRNVLWAVFGQTVVVLRWNNFFGYF